MLTLPLSLKVLGRSYASSAWKKKMPARVFTVHLVIHARANLNVVAELSPLEGTPGARTRKEKAPTLKTVANDFYTDRRCVADLSAGKTGRYTFSWDSRRLPGEQPVA